MKTIKLLSLSMLVLFIASCSSDDDGGPQIVNEEEVITTLTLTLSPQAGGADIVFTSRDLDADGPNPPTVTVADLAPNTTYTGVVQVLNETENPAEDITEEVEEEDDEHQFFYQVIGNAAVTTAYTDQDGDGNPVGIQITLTTGDASTGNLVVTLRHQLDKNAAGVSDGDITNAGGDTDVEVTFPVTIQ
ncbi:type 1 periplasmic binding fold superfamily protein [Leptobacterium flavescens]|uniref:Type 1 periplasmic binding fold superfamily protein n=1 Tax=Leptobacterium flavescens TaxID=472055 RepID=A0A6P0UTQ5_9FLAO|nr:type 1 periplasmic binding fold superfamily protein [Leptobacterium flavescens]NER13806.1 type 1 periplasmic binding fold superfamily protein [Leptobacterium flavescens]